VQRGCHVGAVLPALADPPVRREDGAQPLRAVPRLLADGGQPGQWSATWRLCQAATTRSTSGKYLYNVARPMPAAAAICDMLTPKKSTAAHQLAGRRQDGVA